MDGKSFFINIQTGTGRQEGYEWESQCRSSPTAKAVENKFELQELGVQIQPNRQSYDCWCDATVEDCFPLEGIVLIYAHLTYSVYSGKWHLFILFLFSVSFR